MNWLLTAFIAATCFSISNSFIKLYQPKLGSGLGLVIFTLGGLLMTIFLTFIAKVGGPAAKNVGNAPWIALFSGLVWAVANFFFFTLFANKAPISIAMPVVVGGIGVGGVLAGLLVFGESLNITQIIGIVVVLAGSVILAKG